MLKVPSMYQLTLSSRMSRLREVARMMILFFSSLLSNCSITGKGGAVIIIYLQFSKAGGDGRTGILLPLGSLDLVSPAMLPVVEQWMRYGAVWVFSASSATGVKTSWSSQSARSGLWLLEGGEVVT